MQLGSKNFDNVKLAAWLLRLGLAFVFLYAAVSSFQHPLEWVGYLPGFLTKTVDAHTLLKIFSIIEIVLALWLLTAKFTRYAALAAAFMLAGIIVVNPGQLLIAFRDVGLVTAALALACIG